jgi:hypothetical protein
MTVYKLYSPKYVRHVEGYKEWIKGQGYWCCSVTRSFFSYILHIVTNRLIRGEKLYMAYSD